MRHYRVTSHNNKWGTIVSLVTTTNEAHVLNFHVRILCLLSTHFNPWESINHVSTVNFLLNTSSMTTTNGILRRQDTWVYLEHGLPQNTQLVKIQRTTLPRKDLLLLKKIHKLVIWLECECVGDILVVKGLHQFLPLH